jgi:4-hydroxybenzoyl-CoA thioesterase/acyl-CoA thioester hydrolase
VAEIYRTSRIVQWYDTDAAGIAHFTAFFRWMEEAEHEFLRFLGLSVAMPDGDGQITWPRVSVGADFRHAVKFEDVVELALRLERVGDKSVSYCYEVTHGERAIATIRATAVCCRMLPGSAPVSIRIPESISAKLERYCHAAQPPRPNANWPDASQTLP